MLYETVTEDATVDSVFVWSGIVPIAGEVGLSVGVVVEPLPAVDPAAVSGLLVVRDGVGLLWVTVSVFARVGVVTEVVVTLVVDVKVRVVTGIEVIEVGVLTAFVGVIKDVTGGVDVSSVARESAEESLVEPGVVFQVDVAREGVSVVLPGGVVAAVEDGVPVLVGVVYETVTEDATVDSVFVWSG